MLSSCMSKAREPCGLSLALFILCKEAVLHGRIGGQPGAGHSGGDADAEIILIITG